MSWAEPRPLHRDLVDQTFRRHIADLPRSSLVALAQLYVLAERHDSDAMKGVIEGILDLSPSVEGKRAAQIVEAMRAAERPDVPIGQEGTHEVGL